MVFSSIPFLFYFLPFLLILYFLVPKRLRLVRNGVLLAASLLFYAWGEGVFVGLLLGLTVINHVIGSVLARRKTKALLTLGIIVNLTGLAWYKYAGFAADIFGLSAWQGPELLLGISFFTFQAISFLVDIYRSKSDPPSNWFNSALYICAFPQLIAGPIVRYHTIAEQIEQRDESVDSFVEGIRYFVIGLSQKVLLANTLGQTSDLVFAQQADSLSLAAAWLGAICFSLQLYFDFAGYSNMAIGLGRFFGFKFPKNFDFPYISASVQEFWRRWHITLSQWFRDYLYIPLGGNRKGRLRTYANLWIVFLLCGLWHGAAWTFVIWGAWHGLFLVIERLGLERVLKAVPKPLGILYTLMAVMLGFVIFRAENMGHAMSYFGAMVGLNDAEGSAGLDFFIGDGGWGVLLIAVLCATPIFQTVLAGGTRMNANLATLLGYAGLMALFGLCVIMLSGSAYNPFLYFRF